MPLSECLKTLSYIFLFSLALALALALMHL